jgi:hypothetical protein
MPTCRIAPPSMRRCATARAISSRLAGEERPAGRAEPLGERDRDKVRTARRAGLDAEPARDRRVPEPRAVEEGGDAALARRGADAPASSCAKTTPPARLCVFSISTRVVGG